MAAHQRKVRFALEVANAMSTTVGKGRVGLCLSLWLTHYGTFPWSLPELIPKRL